MRKPNFCIWIIDVKFSSQQLYLGHERRLLSYKFPLYLHEITAAILQGNKMSLK